MKDDNRPIGVFDSGLGGLTVLRSLKETFPNESFIYFGDTARLPYGTKSQETIIRYSKEICDFLNKKDVKNKNLSDLIQFTKLESSKSEIKRLIKNKGIKINNLKIERDLAFEDINLEGKNFFKLSIGKKKHFKIEIN